jgi:hypothetical protein
MPAAGSPVSSSVRAPRRSRTLGDDLVRVDRLEVDLPREKEVASSSSGSVSSADCRAIARVLDETRLQVRVLDDEQLVGALQQLVDRRAHRALDDRASCSAFEPCRVPT